jgi:hypothetical protein
MTIVELYRQIMADDAERFFRQQRELLDRWVSEDAEPEPCVIVDAGDATGENDAIRHNRGTNYDDD